MEPPNNGHIGDEHFVHCSEVVTSSEVEMYGQYIGRGGGGGGGGGRGQTVLSTLSECPFGKQECIICTTLAKICTTYRL